MGPCPELVQYAANDRRARLVCERLVRLSLRGVDAGQSECLDKTRRIAEVVAQERRRRALARDRQPRLVLRVEAVLAAGEAGFELGRKIGRCETGPLCTPLIPGPNRAHRAG